jgi:hypothetical protein
MRLIESRHAPLSPVDLIRVLADLVYGLSQVWVKTEATVQRNSIEENKNK